MTVPYMPADRRRAARGVPAETDVPGVTSTCSELAFMAPPPRLHPIERIAPGGSDWEFRSGAPGPDDRPGGSRAARRSEKAEKGIPIDFHPLGLRIVAFAAPLGVIAGLSVPLTLTRRARGRTRAAADRARSAGRTRW